MNKHNIEQLLETVVKINKFNVNLPSLNHKIEKLEAERGFDEIYDIVLDYIGDNESIYELDDLINDIDDVEISFRTKTEKSLREKWNKNLGQKRPLKKVFNDIIGIRIVTKDSIDNIMDYIIEISENKQYKIIPIDFRKTPKSPDDGYRGIHIYADTNSKGFRVEIQIWSELDSILNFYTHQNVYKVNGAISYPIQLRQWIDEIPIKDKYGFKEYIFDIIENPEKYIQTLSEVIIKYENKKYSMENILLQHYKELVKLDDKDEYILTLKKWIDNMPNKEEGIKLSFIEYIYTLVFEEVI